LNNQLRLCTLGVVENKIFDNLILVCIIVPSVLVALDILLYDPSSSLKAFLRIANYLFLASFVVDMVIKMVAHLAGSFSTGMPIGGTHGKSWMG
tara:strand:+ start:179 stop:460 length:282 start_codon:yes stop_codon:yes gene_type:complete